MATLAIVLTPFGRLRYSGPSSSSSTPLLFQNQPTSYIKGRRACGSKVRLDDSTDPQLGDLYGAVFGGRELIPEEEEDDDDDEEETEESSIDLLIRFLQSLFRKVAKRAKKASRSVLPAAIPPQLVSFAVDGILLLASLSIAKALLEVACTLGGSVFIVILLLRVIWASISYFQSNGGNWNQGSGTFETTQPA